MHLGKVQLLEVGERRNGKSQQNIKKIQENILCILDEPTTGLHLKTSNIYFTLNTN
jgi:excinuclease UvrABC ATPase subunit